jgi:2,3-bisphosphoglycerate-dependent phosphoglycerate mutase
MKRLIYCFMCFMGIFFNKSNAQPVAAETVQLILFRLAEKEQSDDADPDLSAAGKQRAERLVTLLKDMQIDELYATPYKRTAQTLAPLAAGRQLQITTYNPGQLRELAQTLSDKKGKTIVVAGHANTVPELLNMLLGENKYTTLPENDFGKVWVLTLNRGKAVSCLLFNTN